MDKVKRSAKPAYNADVEKRLDIVKKLDMFFVFCVLIYFFILKARRLFKRYDTDGSGYLNDNEVVGLIKDTYAEMGMKNYAPSSEDVRIWL